MPIIGLCGKKSSGKDTIADYLVKHYGFQKLSFAAPLKKICQDLFLLTEEQCHDPSKKEEKDPRWNRSPRELFQLMGTDWIRRDIDPDFWVKRMRLLLQRVPREANIVVSDVRFSNERDLIEECGGVVWGIDRPLIQMDTHPSEKEVESIIPELTVLLRNDQDLSSLYKKVETHLLHASMFSLTRCDEKK